MKLSTDNVVTLASALVLAGGFFYLGRELGKTRASLDRVTGSGIGRALLGG